MKGDKFFKDYSLKLAKKVLEDLEAEDLIILIGDKTTDNPGVLMCCHERFVEKSVLKLMKLLQNPDAEIEKNPLNFNLRVEPE